MAHNRSMGILVAKESYKKFDYIWVAVNDGFFASLVNIVGE